MSFKNKKKKNETSIQHATFYPAGFRTNSREKEREKKHRRVALAEARELGGGERR